MANMIQKKTASGEQPAEARRSNFGEVSQAYTPEQAAEEASRCLGCKAKPCVGGCPVNVDIPEFIGAIKAGDTDAAFAIIRRTNALPAVCGRVCPQENQCEKLCVRGAKGEPVAIGRLERFAADRASGETPPPARDGEKKAGRVAIIGSGPAGLTCAGDLADMGYEVTVFEALHTLGGVLAYGIPEFRLPKGILAKEIGSLEARGVRMMRNTVIGKTLTVEDLIGAEGYDAVFAGTGAGLPSLLDIPGENLSGVASANEYLTRINMMKAYDSAAHTPVFTGRRTVVVGGGNVAMDAARCAVRMGAERVTVIYRRSREEMPARAEEIGHAEEEGIEMLFLTAPVEILGGEAGEAVAVRCVRMTLSEPDSSGRARPVEAEGSEFDIPADMVIVAIGSSPNPLLIKTTPGLDADVRGCILAGEDCATTKPGLFAGGDAVTGAATVIGAMGAGKAAAAAIDRYIKNKRGV